MCRKSSQNTSIIFFIPHASWEGRVSRTLFVTALFSFHRLVDEYVVVPSLIASTILFDEDGNVFFPPAVAMVLLPLPFLFIPFFVPSFFLDGVVIVVVVAVAPSSSSRPSPASTNGSSTPSSINSTIGITSTCPRDEMQ